ncbi:hypothetical protein [Oceanobacillus massiliensis]|uniref:hypothetical protein n=1 Tax=Oceanobacillus massiliensis TaxID=1465765 RepID=UPI0012B5BE1E|nr:hypothetical protein [Oceanobacillus massiliensis]
MRGSFTNRHIDWEIYFEGRNTNPDNQLPGWPDRYSYRKECQSFLLSETVFDE